MGQVIGTFISAQHSADVIIL